MRYRQLGRTGFAVSEIGHGLWGMSGWSGSEDRESREALQLSADLGCTFFDTAWAYGEGKSDGLAGELLARESHGTNAPRRPWWKPKAATAAEPSASAADERRLYVASKVPPKNRKWPSSPKDAYKDVFPARHVLKHARRIRAKLGVDSIDLLQFHVWDDHWTDEAEFRETVEKLKADGLIRRFGLSLNRWEPENGIAALRTGLVDTVQVVYNIFDQAPEDKLFPACQELNIGVIARVPFDEGSLGGKLTAETKFPESDWRSRYFNAENLAKTLERVGRLKGILPEGVSLPELTLRFILSHPAVSTTIPGMRKPGHVRQNLAASDAGPLDPALLRELRNHRWDRTLHRGG